MYKSFTDLLSALPNLPNAQFPVQRPEGDADLYTDYDNIDFGDLDFFPVDSLVFTTGNKVKKTKKQIFQGIEKKRKDLKKAAAQPPTRRLLDKISFTLGVANIALTMFVLGKWPDLFYWIYTVKFPLLMLLRFVLYHKSKWHYFLLDFCYFANIVVFLYLHAFPDSCTMFKLSFVYTSGPLAWAIALWSNSMVFHSLDKITSLFIHLTPALVMWALRWFPGSESAFNTCASQDSLTITDYLWYPLLGHVVWQALYFLKVQVVDIYKFKANPKYMTSFLWLTSDKNKSSFIYKLANILGKKHRMFMFGVFQVVYTILTCLMTPLLWSSYNFHCVFLILLMIMSAWNGASFYIEVFSVRYQQSLKECEKQWQELQQAMEQEKEVEGSKKGD